MDNLYKGFPLTTSSVLADQAGKATPALLAQRSRATEDKMLA